jgi:hypothetical protein
VIIRMTTAQRNACMAVGGELHQAWIFRAEKASKDMWDVPMPAIGWRQVLDGLTAAAFNPYGQRRSRVAGSMHRAVKRVATSLAHLEAHPAFNGAALPGEHDTVFLAWWAPDGGYSPYPNGDVSWMMQPEWLTAGGIRVTRWRSSLPIVADAGDLLNPGEHYRLSDARRDRVDATGR